MSRCLDDIEDLVAIRRVLNYDEVIDEGSIIIKERTLEESVEVALR